MVEKIISGGQTGADMGGLLAARDLGIPTGGWAAKGWMTEKGPKPELAEFGLEECTRKGYPARTLRNVEDSDGTVIFTHKWGRGSELTRHYVDVSNKTGFYIDPQCDLIEYAGLTAKMQKWLDRYNIKVLNVAGSRESSEPGIQEWVRKWLTTSLDFTRT